MLGNKIDIIGRQKRTISPTDQLSESPPRAQHCAVCIKGVFNQSEVLSLSSRASGPGMAQTTLKTGE